jgi:hypothetical protein
VNRTVRHTTALVLLLSSTLTAACFAAPAVPAWRIVPDADGGPYHVVAPPARDADALDPALVMAALAEFLAPGTTEWIAASAEIRKLRADEARLWAMPARSASTLSFALPRR